MARFFKTFPGDYYGKRCFSGEKSSDVFNDYLDILHGVACDESTLTWSLNYLSTDVEFQSWENHMLQGFSRCDKCEFTNESTRMFLALRRVDEVVARWWDEEMCDKDIIDATWYDLDNFLRD